MVENKSFFGRLFQICNYAFLGAFACATFLPFVHVVASSFADPAQLARGGLIFWPEHANLLAYKEIFATPTIFKGLRSSIVITVIGTFVSLSVTMFTAYPLAQSRFRSKNIFMGLVIVTLVFDGGMIPTFMVVRDLGLIDSIWALILPVAVLPAWLIVMRNFIKNIPGELQEASYIEGANDAQVFFRIVLPLSKPALATFVVLYGVMYWNSWFSALIYLNNPDWYPIQVILRQIILSAQGVGTDSLAQSQISPMGVRMAVVVVATLPIMCVYPFLQKYFVQGMMLGSVKG
jgi:putative aldouronate transport system permease protein